MPQLILSYSLPVEGAEGRSFQARAYGSLASDGTWHGFLAFVPAEGHGGASRLTRRETTQPNLEGLNYWASGLTPVYLDGALARSDELSSEETDVGAEAEGPAP